MENIMIVKTCKRRSNADTMQKVLTEYGCIVKTRLGLHEAGDVCSDEGVIILQLADQKDEIEKFEKALSALDGITVKTVSI